MKFDVVIIGAGVIGNAIAQNLSKYDLSIAVLEKEADTAFGISGRNSGVVHSGFNNPSGMLKASLCVSGCEGFEEVAKQLGIEYKRTGKLLVATDEEEKTELIRLKKQGEINGAKGLALIGQDLIKEINSRIKGIAGLYSEKSGIFDPFEYTIALANSACENGVKYFFNNKVEKISKAESTNSNEKFGCISNNGSVSSSCKSRGSNNISSNNCDIDKYGENQARFKIKTRKTVCTENFRDFDPAKKTENQIGASESEEFEEFETSWLINSAGLFSDEICRMLDIYDYEIHPKRGEYHVLDKRYSLDLKLPVYPVPKKESGVLGIHLTNTMAGNVLIGPSGENIDIKEDYETTKYIMDKLLEEGSGFIDTDLSKFVIRSFSGVRPKLKIKGSINISEEDFIIKEAETVDRFIILTGIESPGMTCAIPIANMVKDIIDAKDSLKIKADTLHKKKLEEKSPDKYNNKNIICRCEEISEGEILKAFDDIVNIGASPTLRGIKNRTRAGMGRCQGGFCTNRILKLLEEKRAFSQLELCLFNQDSKMVIGRLR